MGTLFLLRLASFAGMAWLSLSLDRIAGLSVFYAVLFGHYVVQVIYSPKQVATLFSGAKRARCWALLIGLFAIAQFTPYLPMPIYFGIHFVFSDIYTGTFARMSTRLKGFRLVSCSAVYLLCMRNVSFFEGIPEMVLYSLLGIGICGVILNSEKETRFGLIGYELAGAAFATVLPLVGKFQLKEIIFCHLVWWAIYPLRFSNQSKSRYVVITAVVTLLFLVFTPLTGSNWISLDEWKYLANLFGNVHVTLSFALSASNPAWINAIFQAPAQTSSASSGVKQAA